MRFTSIADRVRFDFIEMPGMELTMSQAGRLWNLGTDDCRHVLDSLVDAGFLRWTPKRTVIRTGVEFSGGMAPSHISVRTPRVADNTVGLD